MRDQPPGSNSPRASESEHGAEASTQASRVMMSDDVVPPTAMSAPRTTSSMRSKARTGMPSFALHSAANPARVSGRRDVTRISSKRYIVNRQRIMLVPIAPMPTRPSTLAEAGPTHFSGIAAAAVERTW